MTQLDTSQRLSFWFSLGLSDNESCHNLKAPGTSKQTYPEKKDCAINKYTTNFRDGHSIPETFRQILMKKIAVESLPLMEVMKHEGEWFVVRGNRRLFLFQELERRGYLKQVSVQTRNFNSDLFYKQYTSPNKGKSVRIRGYGQDSVRTELDKIWAEYQSSYCTIL